MSGPAHYTGVFFRQKERMRSVIKRLSGLICLEAAGRMVDSCGFLPSLLLLLFIYLFSNPGLKIIGPSGQKKCFSDVHCYVQLDWN